MERMRPKSMIIHPSTAFLPWVAALFASSTGIAAFKETGIIVTSHAAGFAVAA